MSQAPERRDTLLARLLRGAFVLYTGALFTATHLPPPDTPPINVSDKLLHFLAYALLAWLLAAAWSTLKTLEPADLLKGFAALTLFAALDELLQIPVGRHGDVMDWLADTAGSAFGLLASLTTRTLVARLTAPRERPDP